jgi:glycosyltransferase involved in cell wall biosynthesis
MFAILGEEGWRLVTEPIRSNFDMDNKQRLTILTLEFFPHHGGLQEYLLEIANGLEASLDVVVLTPVGGPLPQNRRFSRVVASSTNPYYLLKQIRESSPDILLLGHAHPRLLLAGSLWGRYATLTQGNDFLAAQKRWHRPLFNSLLGRSRPLITITQAMAARLTALGMPPPLVVLPGTDPTRFTPAGEPPADPTLLTVSRLVSRKGIDTVLQALPAVLSEFPTLRYRIAGEGPEREPLEALAHRLGVDRAAEFLGFVPDEELPDLYRGATVFVMPSREEVKQASIEGFGIVYLEASASGLPVIAARSGGALEAVLHEETGLLISPDNPNQLAAATGRLLGDPLLARHFGHAGRRWVEGEMNWERAVRQMREALQASTFTNSPRLT